MNSKNIDERNHEQIKSGRNNKVNNDIKIVNDRVNQIENLEGIKEERKTTVTAAVADESANNSTNNGIQNKKITTHLN